MNARTRFHPSSFIFHPSPGARAKPRRYALVPRRSSFILHPSSFPRSAFTLVEMLVVIVILTMLAGMVMFAIRGAQESAREQKTKATIQKLHEIVTELYGSYETRRVPINTSGMGPLAAAQARLYALRDIMRMEMPERWSDIQNGPLFGESPPALYQAYRQRCLDGVGNLVPSPANAPAECLYLIVTMAGGEDARAQFGPDEIGDVDGDGFPEFIDGWGRPIFFLRWAPGVNDSACQCNIFSAADRVVADREYHDPFDTQRVDNASVGRPAWGLVPLIYSAGPDGQYGVAEDDAAPNPPYAWNNDTYLRLNLMGMPTADARGDFRHYDNIHNHRAQTP